MTVRDGVVLVLAFASVFVCAWLAMTVGIWLVTV